MQGSIRLRNNVNVMGMGDRTLLFAHGFGCDQSVWRFVAPSFAKDNRVVLFDYVGCGRSDLSAYDRARYGELGGYARDLLEICASMELENIVFVGHSVSCMTGILASIQKPSLFDRLVLIAPSPRYLNDPPDYQGGFEQRDIEGLLDLMDQNFLSWATTFADVAIKDPARARELRDSFCSTDPMSIRQFAQVTLFSDLRAELPRVPKPCLVVQCSNDDIAPVAVGEFVHRSLPRSTYRLIDVPGHCPQMSHPASVVSAISEYLASSASGSA